MRQPIAVMGDFNSVSTNHWRQILQNDLMFTGALTHAGRGYLNTFPSKHRTYGRLFSFISIDEIYLRGFTRLAGKVLPEHLGSDHYPVLLEATQ
jgi:endonuclease/exonuclease/phosphatase (EEP) superfamily protein YafD